MLRMAVFANSHLKMHASENRFIEMGILWWPSLLIDDHFRMPASVNKTGICLETVYGSAHEIIFILKSLFSSLELIIKGGIGSDSTTLPARDLGKW